MKAYEIEQFGLENLRVTERAEPVPAASEVLIRFRAASLNYRDLMVVSGDYNPRMAFPATPLSDGAGVIEAVGSAVTCWKPGDRVMPIFVQKWLDGEPSDEHRKTALGAGPRWDGVLREYGTFDAESIVKIPEHLSFDEAAALPCAGVTAWNALAVSGKLRAGESVLTLGTGGVSVFAVQIARLFGARVISTTGSEEKVDRLKKLGAGDVINYRDREDWDRAVLDLTGGMGVDHVVEVGGSGTLGRSVNAARVGGHVAMIGVLSSGGDFNPASLLMKSVRLQGIFVGSRAMSEDFCRALEVAAARPVVDRIFDFDDARAAFEYMRSGEHFGKVVIRF